MYICVLKLFGFYMKLAVIGSRTFIDFEKMKSAIETFEKEYGNISEIVSGGAKGTDTLAERFAAERDDIKLTIFHSQWHRYKAGAGKMRNSQIAEHCEMLLAFWDGVSRGTKDTITKVNKMGKRVVIIDI